MKTVIMIPTYNESENITNLIQKIYTGAKCRPDVVVVDDNSPDKTAEIVKNLDNKYRVKVILRKKNKGYGKACIDGFKQLRDRYDILLTMDSDLSHNPKVIDKMVARIEQGADVVIGSRYVKGGGIVNWPLTRRVISKGANLYCRIVLGLSPKDCTSGYRAYSKKVLKNIDLDSITSKGYSFLEELLYKIQKKGFKISETPILFEDRKVGTSKLSKEEIIKFFFAIIRIRFSR